jgi:hypothetical protein
MPADPVHYREEGSVGSSPSAENELVAAESLFALRGAISSLTPKQQLVVQLRYGFWDGTAYSLEQVAKLMKVTNQSVSRIEQRALEALRKGVGKMDDLSLVDSPYPHRDEISLRQTHRPHPADWRATAGGSLEYIGQTDGWYLAPPCEGIHTSEGEVTYVIHAPSVGKVKIGRTTNLSSRLSTLRTGSPVHIEVYRVYTNEDEVSEEYLHKKFERHRLHGEWFDDVILDELPE